MWKSHGIRYNPEVVQRAIQELISNEESIRSVARRYGIGHNTLRRHLLRYKGTDPAVAEDEAAQLRARVVELERLAGRLALENDFLKKFARYGPQKKNETLSMSVGQVLASPGLAASWDLPKVPITTDPEIGKTLPSSKND